MKLVIDNFNTNVSSLYLSNKYFRKHKIVSIVFFPLLYLTMFVWIVMIQYRVLGSDYRPDQFILLTCFNFCFFSLVIVIMGRSMQSICQRLIYDFSLNLASDYRNIKVIKKTIQSEWLKEYLEKYNLKDRSILLSINQSLQYHEIKLANKSSKRVVIFSIVGIATITYWANEYLLAINDLWNDVDPSFNTALLGVFAIVLGLVLIGFMQFMINAVNTSISDIFISEERKSTMELMELLEEMILQQGDD